MEYPLLSRLNLYLKYLGTYQLFSQAYLLFLSFTHGRAPYVPIHSFVSLMKVAVTYQQRFNSLPRCSSLIFQNLVCVLGLVSLSRARTNTYQTILRSYLVNSLIPCLHHWDRMTPGDPNHQNQVGIDESRFFFLTSVLFNPIG